MTPAAPHAAVIRLSFGSLMCYLSGRRAIRNVPADACITALWVDCLRPQYVWIRLEHPSLPAIPPGRKIPQIQIRYQEQKPPNDSPAA